MGGLKRTVLHGEHLRLHAVMVDFGGWEMPVNYETGMVEEHLFTRKCAGIFDISHMGRFTITGSEAVHFLQYVLTSNVSALDIKRAQYSMIPDETGGALDDAYLYRLKDEEYILVVNASNREKDWAHLSKVIEKFDARMEDKSDELAMISIQGPESKNILGKLTGCSNLTEPVKNALDRMKVHDEDILIARTGYTGEPLGFELFIKSPDAAVIWRKLLELGAVPVGLGARDTLRLEAGLPLYGHELGIGADGTQVPIFSCPLAKFAVSFAEVKGDYIGKKALYKQFLAFQKIRERDYSCISDLPRMIRPIALTGKGVARAGCKVFQNCREIGYMTSGTMIPYLKTSGSGLSTKITGEKGMRAIGLALMDSNISINDLVEVEIRGSMVKAVIPPYHLKGDAPPYARPILYGVTADHAAEDLSDYRRKALNLL